jgi:hypothetical protein
MLSKIGVLVRVMQFNPDGLMDGDAPPRKLT